jgi:hypothetical protein
MFLPPHERHSYRKNIIEATTVSPIWVMAPSYLTKRLHLEQNQEMQSKVWPRARDSRLSTLHLLQFLLGKNIGLTLSDQSVRKYAVVLTMKLKGMR